MKAVKNNEIITLYQSLPNSFRSSTGLHYNIKGWSDSEMEDNGLFNVIIDDSYNSKIHNLGEIYWDLKGRVFKKDISEKTWVQSLSELKEREIDNFKHRVINELSKTDWYIIRKADNGSEIPQAINDAREALRSIANEVESEINALTTKAEVITFDFPNI